MPIGLNRESEEKMKVLYILGASWGGMPHYTAELANTVSKYVDVIVLKPRDSNDYLFLKRVKVMDAFEPMQFSRENIRKVFSLNNFKNVFSYSNIRIINKLNPDVIHFSSPYPYLDFFTSFFRLDKKYPVVCTLHNPLSLRIRMRFLTLSELFIYSISKLMNRLIDVNKIIVHTQAARRVLIEGGVRPEKISVIPHGAYTLFKKYERMYKKIDEGNCILLFGQLDRNKGIDVLLKAIPIVISEFKDAKFVIAGESKVLTYYMNEIMKYKSNLEIYNKFIPNECVHYLFRRAKIVVLPYRGAGRGTNQSGVLTIAFSFGKPVIATNAATTPEMIRGCGIMIPPNNPKALAEAIITLLKDNRLRKKMSRNALKKAEELSWDNIAKMHIKVYEEVLNE